MSARYPHLKPSMSCASARNSPSRVQTPLEPMPQLITGDKAPVLVARAELQIPGSASVTRATPSRRRCATRRAALVRASRATRSCGWPSPSWSRSSVRPPSGSANRPQRAPVPWSGAARMRDRLTHHYFDFDPDVLWGPSLRTARRCSTFC
ncbi:HepT-like ribonuclease domain-containing protein [Egicoccus sp. AB-alg2]|uniref:HepT-like ribonuclease domain-containing protein n=1 Tax=Egicoccus sp. AB-alg2 TaxID=3242693 RepID=UPI00359D1B32